MKKVFSLLLSLTMVMALLAGCGGDTTADDTTDDTASNDAAQEETAELSGTVATDGSTSMEEVIGALGEQFGRQLRRVRHLQPHRFWRRHRGRVQRQLRHRPGLPRTDR